MVEESYHRIGVTAVEMNVTLYKIRLARERILVRVEACGGGIERERILVREDERCEELA